MAPPLIRRSAPPSPKVREKAYITPANISYRDILQSCKNATNVSAFNGI